MTDRSRLKRRVQARRAMDEAQDGLESLITLNVHRLKQQLSALDIGPYVNLVRGFRERGEEGCARAVQELRHPTNDKPPAA